MAAQDGLKANAMPSLRISLFCGEALPAALASAWAAAAPNSVIENLYGPTEATIAFTRYRWDPGRSEGDTRFGLVPIGRAFDDQQTLVVGEHDDVIPGAGRGELLLSGTQVTGAYWNDPANTSARYKTVDGVRWYRTGDIVDVDEAGCIHFVGRSDSQIKFRGYRIELREIEAALAAATGTELVVVVPWPSTDHEILGLAGVVAGGGDVEAVTTLLRRTLPDYMVPQLIRFVDRLPTNLSGKLDRKAVLTMLDDAR
jgi:acyl-CoA synthetase (AMP-forming)/AMP-acid ligase II